VDEYPRGVDLSLREAQQCEARNRLAAELVRLPQDLLGTLPVTHAQPDFPDLVERLTGRDVVEAAELLGGAERLGLGVAPGPAESHELRPVHPTDPGETGLRVLLAPAPCRFAPFGGALIVGQLFAHPHHVAVDTSGHLGAELPADGR